jgi:outer membrane putative beta-barrel porin/alpha-amylase
VSRRWSLRPLHRSVVAFLISVSPSASLLRAQIQDNSFLLEEAYNQDRGIVQHISTFSRSSSGDWLYSFTQEWPLGGIDHQLSYTIPLQRSKVTGTGLGDFALNYRYQLIGNPQSSFLMAPRLSLLLPTGREEVGRGAGGVGFQANLPLTLLAGSRVATHWNAGLTVTPSARNTAGDKASTSSFNLGASLIWLLRSDLNLMLEGLWLSTQEVAGAGVTRRENSGYLNPGIRWAFNFKSGLQVVPGLAYTLALGPSTERDALFLYLSFEHPFKAQ